MPDLYTRMGIGSPAAITVISLATMLFCGFLITRVTRVLKLPNVTAYLIAGILLGPDCLAVIPQSFIRDTGFLADIALAFIAFSTGEFFRVKVLRESGFRIVAAAFAESLAAGALVFASAYFLLGLGLTFSLVLAAIGCTTSSASTMVTIRQTGAKGGFVNAMLQADALDSIIGLLAYGVAVSVAASEAGGEINAASVFLPLAANVGVLLLGGAFGFALKWLMPRRRSADNRLIITLSVLFLFCGVCTLLDISPLLGCMSMGTVYINATGDEKLFRQINYFSPPVLLLFFVRSGLNFDLGRLSGAAGVYGGTPIPIIAAVYFAARIAGKYGGAFLGCAAAGYPKTTRVWLGLSLVPQAGVAIGLAALGARTLGGETGAALETVILAAGLLYELIGPACAKLALYKTGSYGGAPETPVTAEEAASGGGNKTASEPLAERVKRIQETLPPPEKAVSEEEQAFDEAAEEYFYSFPPPRDRRINRRR